MKFKQLIFQIKVKGVIAMVDLPANSRLPYLGKQISDTRLEKLAKRTNENPGKRYSSYVMATQIPNVSIDAHPRRKGSEHWVAGRLNEASPGEYDNMWITYENGLPVLVTTRKIEAGEELTFDYGPYYTRTIPPDFKKKYRRGRRVTKPWWLDKEKRLVEGEKKKE